MNNYTRVFNAFILITLPAVKNFSQVDTAGIPSQGLKDSLVISRPKADTSTTASNDIDVIKEPVLYEARDSIVMTLEPKKIFLYGEAHIQYGALDLKAHHIEVDLEAKELKARGRWDSVAGCWQDKPVFTDKDKSFTAHELRYNFETRQGLVTQIFTQEGEGFLHGERVKYKQERYKRDTSEVIYVRRGHYTTCNAEHPHFGIRSGKIKVIPRKRIFTGPAFLVVEDVPTPLGLPFGYFPVSEERTSGIIFPQYGYQVTTGIFLREGGYYWALSPKMDLKFLGSVFTNGSWAAGVASDYKVRYRFSGSLGFNYSRRLEGNDPKIAAEFFRVNEWRFRWTHNQDPKALPGLSFRSDVNVVTAGFNKFNQFEINNFIQNTFTSTVALGYAIPRTPFNLQSTIRLKQNTTTRILELSSPELVWITNRFFPFKSRRSGVRPRRWWHDLYQGLGVTHRTEFGNRITIADTLFRRHIRTLFAGYSVNGVRHTVEATSAVKLFNYISMVPSVRYTEWWNFRKTYRYLDPDNLEPTEDTLRGFFAGRTVNASLNANTNLFTFFNFTRGPVKGIRYLLQPTLGFTYAPYVSSQEAAYAGAGGQLIVYDPFQSVGLFGGAQQPETGALTYSLNSNLEMKVKARRDTGNGELKLRIIEFAGLSGSYNFLADSFQISPLSLQTRNSYLKGRLSTVFSTTLDPYTVEQLANGQFQRRPKLELHSSGRPFRLVNLALNVTLNLTGNNNRQTLRGSPRQGTPVEEWEYVLNHPWEFVDFKIPYNLSLSYVFTYSRPLQQATISNILTVSGEVNITPHTKVDFRSAYDFQQKKFSPSATSLGFSRDLHCWQMDFQWIPFGTLASYVFTLRAKSALLQDLRLNRRRGWVPVTN